MNPNEFNSQNQPAGSSVTPQTSTTGTNAAEYLNVQPATSQAPKSKKNNGIYIALTIFIFIAIALTAFIIVDKFILNKTDEEPEATIVNDLSLPLSSIEVGNDTASAYANALVGRIFTVDNYFEQTITFTSTTEYKLTYYARPESDIPVRTYSTTYGTYTIRDNIIVLSDGDEFTIMNDYLVKSYDNTTKNEYTVYFDSQQYTSVYQNITLALNSYLSNWGGGDSYKAEKNHINHITCSTDSANLTRADSYICDTNIDLYFNHTNADALISRENSRNFFSLCQAYAGLQFYGGICSEDEYAINTNYNLVIRIDIDGYSIKGAYTDAEEEDAKKKAAENENPSNTNQNSDNTQN